MGKTDNPLLQLQEYGQSIWLDFIRRKLLASGELERLVKEDGLRGVTVNPSILDHAIRETEDYDEAIRTLAAKGKSSPEMYEALAVEDVQGATDVLRSTYDRTDGRHGFVSLEVSPYLAYDTEGTVEEARRFWRKVDRPNLMIKVPATREGLPAIERLTAEGINVNVTLLFGLPRYREVFDAYIKGIETRIGQSQPVDRLASVASFFLSRIDVLVDPMLEEKSQSEPLARQLYGQVAIASAKIAYQIYQEIVDTERFQGLRDRGARVQRLLWASTSTKNPEFSDVKYVEALIGPDTVNTVPMETLDAYRDHGNPAPNADTDCPLEEGVEEARQVLAKLPQLGIDLDQVTQQLEDEGVQKFAASYDQVIEALDEYTTSYMSG
jgi:transaldolase